MALLAVIFTAKNAPDKDDLNPSKLASYIFFAGTSGAST